METDRREMMMGKAFLQAAGDYIRRSDRMFWLLTIAVSVCGLLLIASLQRSGTVNFLLTQSMAMLLGYAAAIILSLTDYHYWGRIWWAVGAFALLLTAAVFFFGIQITGTDDVGWIRLPGGLTFQPSELTKICFILTFSQHLAFLQEWERLRRFSGVLTLMLHALVPVGMIHCQGDDGAALVFALLAVIMAFAAGVPLRYFVILLTMILTAVPLAWFKILNSDQKNRLIVLFTSDDSMLRTYGWQQYQGKLSIASGGLWGKGYYNGPRVAESVVPYQENDFIFTVAGEEWGFVGCTVILILLTFLLVKTLQIAAQADDAFGRNIVIGFFALVGTQVLINLGMVLEFLPVIGVTLPFFSAGGTSAACLYLGVGLVQSVRMHPADIFTRPVRLSHPPVTRI